MSAPISDERWAFLLERAGLDPMLAPERFAELREGYQFLARIQNSVRKRRDRAAEPAHIFVHPKGK
ncbi:MAG TPA: hypothetical protein VET89_02250 [Stellaceae bacterium]|jgi:hypothetical protein|nr:hypothetical protein [Stellaceae bacterium]